MNLLEKAVNTYLNAVRTLCPNVSCTALDYLRSGLTVSELKPKHFYMHANVIQQEIGFVFQGLIRAFYIDNQG
ncbi:MAG: Crp/Fnr family transcriptional regulator, partial [Bacteroidetes bacterium]|nr:Crp/Fnr family transcriptional regulator [Bacteroidota bacterium]